MPNNISSTSPSASNVQVASTFGYHEAYQDSQKYKNSMSDTRLKSYDSYEKSEALRSQAGQVEKDLGQLIKKDDRAGIAKMLNEPATCWLLQNYGSDTNYLVTVALAESRFDVLPELFNKLITAKAVDHYIDTKLIPTAIVATGKPELVRALIEAAKNVTDDYSIKLLFDQNETLASDVAENGMNEHEYPFEFESTYSDENTAFNVAVEQYRHPARAVEKKSKDLEILDMIVPLINANIDHTERAEKLNALISEGSDESVIRGFIKDGLNIHHKDKNGCSPIAQAASCNNVSALKYIAQNYTPDTLNAETSAYSDSLLLAAIYNKDPSAKAKYDCVEFLLDKGMDINFQPPGRRPALFEAISQADGSIVKLLLDHKADQTYKNNSGEVVHAKNVVMEHALSGAENYHKYINIAKAILSKPEVDALEALYSSSKIELEHLDRIQQVKIAKEKLDNFIDTTFPLQRDRVNQDSPSMMFNAHYENIQNLLNDIHKRGLVDDVFKGNPILHKAIQRDDSPIENYLLAKLLLKFGSENIINVPNSDGLTPLHIAAKQENKNFIALLVNAHASVVEKDPEGFTALAWAALSNAIESIKALLGLGTANQLEQRDNEGRTALLIAFEQGHYEACELLLDAGAKIDAKALNGLGLEDLATSDAAKASLKHLNKVAASLSDRSTAG